MAALLLGIPWISHIAAHAFIVWEAEGQREWHPRSPSVATSTLTFARKSGVPILGALGPCMPASKRQDGLGLLLGASTALTFEILASILIVIVCARVWYDKRKTDVGGGINVLAIIWRESVGFWLAVVIVHGVNL